MTLLLIPVLNCRVKWTLSIIILQQYNNIRTMNITNCDINLRPLLQVELCKWIIILFLCCYETTNYDKVERTEPFLPLYGLFRVNRFFSDYFQKRNLRSFHRMKYDTYWRSIFGINLFILIYKPRQCSYNAIMPIFQLAK